MWQPFPSAIFGIGINPEKLPHLFDRYYRVDALGHQFSGLGLGLYISSEIINRHNGEIGVYSALGEGSNFWFSIPIDDGGVIKTYKNSHKFLTFKTAQEPGFIPFCKPVHLYYKMIRSWKRRTKLIIKE